MIKKKKCSLYETDMPLGILHNPGPLISDDSTLSKMMGDETN